MSTDVKYPHVTLELVGHDGNAFSILGRLSGALRKGGVPKDEIDAVLSEAQSGDYNHLLQTVMTTVTVPSVHGDPDEDFEEDWFDDDDDDEDYA